MAGHDVVIIGAGHNGLTCAAYLGMAGFDVRVLERRGVVGGAAVTEEFHPGFRNSVASYTVSLLQPKVIRDLDLPRHGLTIVERRAQNFLPLPDGRHLLMGGDRTEREIAKFSARDAGRYAAYCADIAAVADGLRGLVLKAPPNFTGGGQLRAIRELASIGLKSLGSGAAWKAVRLLRQSAGDYLDGIFESDPIKAVLGFDSIVGNFASPYTRGSAYVLLHHVFGEVNGRRGVWGHAIGGMGAITRAMAHAAAAHGVRIDVNSPVREVLMEGDCAAGVVTADGTPIRARAVVSNVDPRTLFQSLVPDRAVPTAMAGRMRRWKAGSGTFRMNVALSRLPNFTCLPGDQVGDHHTAGIIFAPSLAYMDRAYRDALELGYSRQPIVEMTIPSTLDDTLAPPGQHVAALFCQHVSPQFSDGSEAQRTRLADLMIDTVESYAPGFRDSVIAWQAFAPRDLEREFGLPGGDIFHGALTLDQLFSLRPMRGHADHRMPVAGLYLCGSGAHPGGGVTGAPGHNAAQAIISDLRRR
jgi:phytoene dehydrogenase-like protein